MNELERSGAKSFFETAPPLKNSVLISDKLKEFVRRNSGTLSRLDMQLFLSIDVEAISHTVDTFQKILFSTLFNLMRSQIFKYQRIVLPW